MTSQARDLIGDPKAGDDPLFQKVTYGTQTGQVLTRWAMRAGIPKKITFHSARHTHATVLLSRGVDIYTISKLLGHRRVKPTDRYTHLMDNLKKEAVKKLPIFDGLREAFTQSSVEKPDL